MTRVFISYSRKDKEAATWLANELTRRGAAVFIDYQRITSGERFISRLGSEIQNSDYVLLLLSPNSVESTWVQAEVAWALNCQRPIVPVRLAPTSMVNFFFLVHLEMIDLTHFDDAVERDAALSKLVSGLGLPAEPVLDMTGKEVTIIDTGQHQPETVLSTEELDDLFLTAVEVANNDPERAIFLYEQVMHIDPNYQQGKAAEFVRREEERLRPVRLELMQGQVEEQLHHGHWSVVAQLAQDMLVIDPQNAYAQAKLALSQANLDCEFLYEQAVLARRRQRPAAIAELMARIAATCPNYGDPQHLLHGFGIVPALVRYTHEYATLTGHTRLVQDVKFSPDGRLLASGSNDKTVRLWDVATQQLIAVLEERHWVRNLAFSPDGELLAVACRENEPIALWNVREARQVAMLYGHGNPVSSLAFSPDGLTLASGSLGGGIRFFDVVTGEMVLRISAHNARVEEIAFSPDGTQLASCSNDCTVKLWNMPDGDYVTTYLGHSDYVRSVVFSPDGLLLATASDDKTVRLWPLNGDDPLILTGHTGHVNNVAFTPDGAILASSSDHMAIRLWDVKQGRELAALDGHHDAVHAITFSPDGTLLASASDDDTVKVWGL